MKFTVQSRKNFVIFSLVLMLGLIGYINFKINEQALLQTSNELERYELAMMEQSGMLTDSLDEENTVVFNDEEMDDEDLEQMSNNIGESQSAMVVDSKGNNVADSLTQETSGQINSALVNKQAMKSSTYFIETKLQRDKKRSEMISQLNRIIESVHTSESSKEEALKVKLQVISSTEREVLIENMIMAKGFEDAIVHLTEKTINIVVQSEKLSENDVAKIVDIIRRETDIGMDNIIIMNRR